MQKIISVLSENLCRNEAQSEEHLPGHKCSTRLEFSQFNSPDPGSELRSTETRRHQPVFGTLQGEVISVLKLGGLQGDPCGFKSIVPTFPLISSGTTKASDCFGKLVRGIPAPLMI